ncbi:hypothetical protein SRIMM317S_06568 [Streptomyces rimosus subsp. rimosus]
MQLLRAQSAGCTLVQRPPEAVALLASTYFNDNNGKSPAPCLKLRDSLMEPLR